MPSSDWLSSIFWNKGFHAILGGFSVCDQCYVSLALIVTYRVIRCHLNEFGHPLWWQRLTSFCLLKLTYEPNLVQNMAQKTASCNSSKWRTYWSLTKNGDFWGFSWPWAKILTDQCLFEVMKVNRFQKTMLYFNKNSRFFDLINQSVECHSKEPWLPESGIYSTPPGSSQPLSWSGRIRQKN